jgi:Rrf2 family transcriptional regulator, iron-sulfur cluster assembly transcription factor
MAIRYKLKAIYGFYVYFVFKTYFIKFLYKMFSKATEYALRATIYISQKSTEEKMLGLAEIAKAIDSPQSFTAKILQKLSKGNKVISSARGPNGGFYMTQEMKKMPIRRVLMAMKEDEVIEKCIIGLAQCSEKEPCPMHAKYKFIKTQTIQMFDSVTIQSLADEMGKRNIFISNS